MPKSVFAKEKTLQKCSGRVGGYGSSRFRCPRMPCIQTPFREFRQSGGSFFGELFSSVIPRGITLYWLGLLICLYVLRYPLVWSR